MLFIVVVVVLLFVVCRLLFDVCCLVFVVCCLVVVCCVLVVGCWLLVVGCCCLLLLTSNKWRTHHICAPDVGMVLPRPCPGFYYDFTMVLLCFTSPYFSLLYLTLTVIVFF